MQLLFYFLPRNAGAPVNYSDNCFDFFVVIFTL